MKKIQFMLLLLTILLMISVQHSAYAGGTWNGWILYDEAHDDSGRTLYFVNNKTGWIFDVLGFNDLSKTNDGGRTWEKQDIGMKVLEVFFVDDATGWAVGIIEEWKNGKATNLTSDLIDILGIIKHTTDGGKTWELQYKKSMGKDFANGLFGVSFVNRDSGWATGNKGIILHTTDGGKHWKQQKTGDTNFVLQKIYFLDTHVGWAIGCRVTDGWKGIVLYTEDGGEHWRIQYSMKDVWFRDVYFTDRHAGWITADAENDYVALLLYTADGGTSWSEKPFMCHAKYARMAFLDRNRGVVSSQWSDPVCVTTDGGKTWNQKRLSVNKYPWNFSELFQSQAGK